jgi:4-amino-4-deoxy-L-arabinose transferase-like glycosyltransferase
MTASTQEPFATGETSSPVRTRDLVTTALALVLLYLTVGIHDHGIWSPTEPAVAGVVWNMFDGSGLAVPRINEMAYLEKPPLYYWLSLLSVRTFGLNAPALRLPSALLGLGALLAFHVAVRRSYGAGVALVTVPIVGSSFLLWEMSHRASTDAGALFFSFLAYSIFVVGLEEEPRRPRRFLDHDLALAAVLALSFLVKNLFVPMVVLVPVILTLAILRRWRRITRILVLFGVFLVLVALPWGFALHHEGGWLFVKVALFDNSVGRFFEVGKTLQMDQVLFNDVHVTRRRGPFFYVLPLLLIALPWAVITLPELWKAARTFRTSALKTFTAIGFGSAFLVLSLSSSKVIEYLLPLCFFLGLAAAGWMDRELHHGQGRGALFFGHVYFLCALFTAVPAFLFARTREPRALAATLVALVLLGACLLLPRTSQRFSLALTLVVLSEGVAFGPLIRELDRHKSTKPFFALIHPALAGREIVTTRRDDTHLPLVNFKLRQRVKILTERDAIVAALSGARPVAVIVPTDFENELGTIPGGLRLVRLQASEGKRSLVCYLNVPPVVEPPD